MVSGGKCRSRSLYRFNFHDKGERGAEPSAGHTLVLGRTGSGKTLGTAFLMAQARRVHARILVIDKDRGLEMAVRALGGSYSAIRIGEATGFNPFQTEVDEREVNLSRFPLFFPEKRAFLKESNGNGWFGPETSRVAGAVRQIWSSFWDSVLNRKRRVDPPGVEIMLIHYRDDSVNRTDVPIEMGEPGTNWAYTVQPGERMFPRGHVVICTPDTILWNGPNRYWHGKIPLVKFTFVTAPWTILGLSIIQDILPLQHSLNESVRGLDDARNKILRRDVIADQKAMP